jgi:glutathione S-transferase
LQITLVYFKFPFWRAEVSRLALHLGGIDFENRFVTGADFKTARQDGSLPFGQMPILIVDGETIAQTGAIARFCGKLGGLYPTEDALAAAKIDQLIDAATDITNQISPTMRIKDTHAKLAARKVLAEESLPKWLSYLEALAPTDGRTYFVGNTLTIADLAIWRLMDWIKGGILDGVPVHIIDPYPGLQVHHDRIGSIPKIQQWMRENYD